MARIRQAAAPLGLLILALSPIASSAAEPPLRGWLVETSSPFSAAPPFYLSALTETRNRALTCLATAIYYESANQPIQGQAAVAQVVLNRMRHPAFPKSVCGVVYEGAKRPGCQFTFACDGSLARAPAAEGWRGALVVAERALDGYVEASIGASTHYHTTAVHPLWDATMTPTRLIGAHRFYRFPGALGTVGALVGAYAGSEPEIDTTRRVSAAWASSRPTKSTKPLTQPIAFTVWGLPVATVKAGGVVLMAASTADAVGHDLSIPTPGY